nr:hypothetical protein [uncultured Duganella sp.]
MSTSTISEHQAVDQASLEVFTPEFRASFFAQWMRILAQMAAR